MKGDGFISPAEARRLEAEADAILRADARRQSPRKGRSGIKPYAKKYGLMTRTHTNFEVTGFTNQQLEQLASGVDNRDQGVDA